MQKSAMSLQQLLAKSCALIFDFVFTDNFSNLKSKGHSIRLRHYMTYHVAEIQSCRKHNIATHWMNNAHSIQINSNIMACDKVKRFYPNQKMNISPISLQLAHEHLQVEGNTETGKLCDKINKQTTFSALTGEVPFGMSSFYHKQKHKYHINKVWLFPIKVKTHFLLSKKVIHYMYFILSCFWELLGMKYNVSIPDYMLFSLH